MQSLILRLLAGMNLHGSLQVTLPDGSTEKFGDGSGDRVHLRVNDMKALRRVAVRPDPNFPEVYMRGGVDFLEGNVYDLLKIAYSDNGSGPQSPLSLRRLRFLLRRIQQFNSKDRARHNVEHHYDLSRELYDMFLDTDKQYSCAYFPRPDMTLEEAQAAKKKHIAGKLLLEPGMKVLDIGSGWGGMGLTLAKEHGADVLGVTLSSEQLQLSNERAAAEGLSRRAKFELKDYRDLEGPFDRIVSVGMFEHVGINHYAEFFEKSYSLLDDKGVMVLHTIGRTGPPDITSPFIHKYIFPGGYIPALSEIMPHVEESGLHITDVEILTDHYAETLKQWRERFMARRDEAVALYDEQFARMWEFYLAASEASFRFQDMVVFQLQMAKDKLSIPRSRDYITEFDHRDDMQGAAKNKRSA